VSIGDVTDLKAVRGAAFATGGRRNGAVMPPQCRPSCASRAGGGTPCRFCSKPRSPPGPE